MFTASSPSASHSEIVVVRLFGLCVTITLENYSQTIVQSQCDSS